MEETSNPPSIFSPADIGLILEKLIKTPARIEPAAAGILAAAAVFLGLLGDGLFYGTRPGINIPIWHASLIALLIAASSRFHCHLEKRQHALLGVSFLFSALLAWRGSPTLLALDVLAAAGFMLLAVALPPRLPVQRMGFVTFVFACAAGAFSMLTGGIRLLAHSPLHRSTAADHSASLARALFLALPLVLIFGGLFIAADAVIESQVRGAFTPELGKIVQHVFWFGASSGAAAGVFWCALGYETPEAPTADLPEARRLKAIEVGIVLGALTVLFAIFVAVQLRYLFGGRELVQQTVDLTYAQYARRGFFELVIASALLLPVLLSMNWARRRDRRTALVFRALSAALVVLLGVVMASALQRLHIYKEEFGLTELRLYPAAFLFWLATVFLCFVGTVLRDRVGHFLWGTLALAAVAGVALNIASPDALIARTNTSRLDDGRRFDAEHAALLGPEAVPVLVARLDRLTPADRCIVARSLLDRWSDGEGDLRSWNYGRARAFDAVRQNEARVQAACGT